MFTFIRVALARPNLVAVEVVDGKGEENKWKGGEIGWYIN